MAKLDKDTRSAIVWMVENLLDKASTGYNLTDNERAERIVDVLERAGVLRG